MTATARKQLLGDPPSEKTESHWADKTATMLGYQIVKFSQPQRAMQTRGIPDRLYLHPIHKLAIWAEMKSEIGKLSPHQKVLHQQLRDAGQQVVHGTANVVGEYLVTAIKRKYD